MLRIAVHASEDVVHTKIGHEDGEECHYHVCVEPAGIVQPLEALLVEGGSVDEEGDECPHFLRIPRPVAAPRHIGPHGSEEDACAQEEGGWIEQQA